MLEIGNIAPSFALPDADMKMADLSRFQGKQNVVIYFYPKDDTPGCTVEAIDFTNLSDEFAEAKTVVFGVSRRLRESRGVSRQAWAGRHITR
jgi:peroxiredoxin Q/BCP